MYYTYHTPRLSLNIMTDAAAELVLDFYNNNRDLEQYEAIRPAGFYTKEYQRLSLEYEFNLASQGNMYRFWLLEEGRNDRIVGTISIRNILRSPFSRCEIGYKIDKDHRRRGYAKESLSLVRDIIFDDLRLHRIEAAVLPDNTASMRLLESLGFSEEGYFHNYMEVAGKYRDHRIYAATRIYD